MALVLDELSIAQVEDVVKLVNECTDSFNYVFDIVKDAFYIASSAKKIFNLPSEKFENATKTLLEAVYPDDRALIIEEIDEFKRHLKSKHALEYRWLSKNKKPVFVSSRAMLVLSGNAEKQIVIGQISISNDEDKIDHLTGLPVQSRMMSDFASAWQKTRSISGFILKIDIDNLATINEQYGVAIGDAVLAKVGDCCRRICGGFAKAYRIGGDEFVCMNLTGKTAPVAQRMYQDLKREISETENSFGYDVIFTVCGGAVAFLNDSSQLDDLLKKCDFAISYAKQNGKNQFSPFNASKYSAFLRDKNIQEKIRESIRNNFAGFELYYQPVIDAKKLYLDSDKTVPNVIGAESLIRWTCHEYGMLNPEEFIPILEKSGMIVSVGRWILRTAFSQCKEWNRVNKNFRISVNLSYIQVQRSDVLRDIETALLVSGADPRNITIELTESGYIGNGLQLQKLTENLSKLGLNVDIDDFGTGYSNLRYLQYLKANTLKLDYTFVQKATGGNEGDRKIIKHITQMAHELGMTVCMEGVETKEDVEKLVGFSPDKFQGFYFGRPCSSNDFREHHLIFDAKRDVYEKQNNKNQM